jgi:hypothetical protein
LLGIAARDLERLGQVTATLVRHRWSPTRLLADAMSGATGVGSLLRGLPAQLEQLLTDVESGNLQVQAVSPGLESLPDRLQQLGSRLSLMGFAAALSICAAILVPAELRLDPRSVLFVVCIARGAGWTVLGW